MNQSNDPKSLSSVIPWNKPLLDRYSTENKLAKYILLYPSREDLSCPAGADMHSVLHFIAEGEMEKALLMMRRYNPFPVVCGRACHYPCEKGILPQPKPGHEIETIKKKIAEQETSRGFLPPQLCPTTHEQKIGVIGAGKSGLTLASEMRHLGYEVDVFDKSERPGGSLYSLIEKEFHPMLDKEIVAIQECGVKIFTQKEVSAIAPLLLDYAVVVLATGKNSGKLWEYEGIHLDPAGYVQTNEIGQTTKPQVFAIGDISFASESVAHSLGKSHDVAYAIDSLLQKLPKTKKERFLLPVLRRYRAACPYHPHTVAEKNDLSQMASTLKCRSCGLWSRNIEEEFRGEGCPNCADCEHCLASCHYKQVWVTTEKAVFLAKTTEEIASSLYPDKPKVLYDFDQEICTIHAIMPRVLEEKCVACGRCEEVCPYHAIRVTFQKDQVAKAVLDAKVCRGCTLCISGCPTQAIQHPLFQSETMTYEKLGKRGIALFACRWGGLFENFAGESDIFSLMCTRYITPRLLILALFHGANRAKVLSCSAENCHYMGNSDIREKVQACSDLLEQIGLAPSTVSHEEVRNKKHLLSHLKEIPCVPVLPRSENREAIRMSLGEALLALQYFETFSPHTFPLVEENALVAGAIPMLEKLLSIENLLPMGQFMENIRILLQILRKAVSILPGVSGLDMPEEEALGQKARENFQKLLQEHSWKEIFLAFPELSLEMEKINLPKETRLTFLPKILRGKLSFASRPLRVALHGPCCQSHKTCGTQADEKRLSQRLEPSQSFEQFYDEALHLLSEIPNLEIVPLSDPCGHTFWRSGKRTQKETASKLLRKAKEKKVDRLVSLSPYCHSHLSFLLRPGSWREIDIEVQDFYSFLVECLA